MHFPHPYSSLSVPHTEAGSDLPSSLRGSYHCLIIGSYHVALKCEFIGAEHMYENSHIIHSFKKAD